MNRFLKTAALAGLLLLYGFVISLSSGVGFLPDSDFTEQQPASKAESYHSAISKSLLLHTAPTETAVQAVKNIAGSSFKYQPADLAWYTRAAGKLLLAEYLQYNFFSRHLLARLQPCELVFPFHSFW